MAQEVVQEKTMSIKGPHHYLSTGVVPMRSRRSISDIVAVVLLIVIAIAAAVIIYMWLSGLIGSVHAGTSATQVKLEITGARVTEAIETTASGSKYGNYTVYATVYNPPDSPAVSLTVGELLFTNGTMLCSAPGTLAGAPPIAPGQALPIYFNCTGPVTLPGTPLEVVLVTSQGVQVSYATSVS